MNPPQTQHEEVPKKIQKAAKKLIDKVYKDAEESLTECDRDSEEIRSLLTQWENQKKEQYAKASARLWKASIRAKARVLFYLDPSNVHASGLSTPSTPTGEN